MFKTQDNKQAALQISAQTEAQELPVIVEELSIDELAVREEYAACYTVNK